MTPSTRNSTEPQKPGNVLTAIGISLTALWVGTFAILAAWKFDALTTMTLNELGDFLAGASAPIALLWLVVGYFQHGRELRLNTDVLKAQERELRQQVSATTKLAEVAAREAKAAEDLADATRTSQQRAETREIEEAQPVFVRLSSTHNSTMISIKVQNRGGEARDLEIEYDGPTKLSWNRPALFGRDDTGNLQLRPSEGRSEFPLRFAFRYKDRFGLTQRRELGRVHITRPRGAAFRR